MQLPTRMRPAPAIAATKAAASAEEVIDVVEPGEPHDDQVDRDDEVQQTRHEQNQNAGDERNERREVGDRDGHGDLLGPGESTAKRNSGSKMSGRGHEPLTYSVSSSVLGYGFAVPRTGSSG